MRDFAARYLSISAGVNDPILHNGRRAFPGAKRCGDKHSLACANGLSQRISSHGGDGGKAEIQIVQAVPVNDKPLLRELSRVRLRNDGPFDAAIGQVAVRGNGLRPRSATSLNVRQERGATRLPFRTLQPLNGVARIRE